LSSLVISVSFLSGELGRGYLLGEKAELIGARPMNPGPGASR
jgi:hypothetical protein